MRGVVRAATARFVIWMAIMIALSAIIIGSGFLAIGLVGGHAWMIVVGLALLAIAIFTVIILVRYFSRSRSRRPRR